MNDLLPDPLPPSVDADRAAQLIGAIRASWSASIAIQPERWTPARPATGHCDVSSIAFWDEFGGELVLSAVVVDGEQTEHHWWNCVDGVDIDLTRSQFLGHEELRIVEVFSHDEIARRRREFRPEVLERSDRFDAVVARRLADAATPGD